MIEDPPAGRLSQPLLEREAELDALRRRLAAAREGAGSVVVVEGPPGIGKSRLLAAARDTADGFLVLRARGGELERGFPWGIARQLFEAPVVLAAAEDRDALLAGAAARAAEPLGLAAGAAGPDATFAALHGLYWLTVNLSLRRPGLLLVDDVQWCDAPSLQFLTYLARRVDELPILLLAAQRSGEPGLDVDAQLIQPTGLSEAAVGRLVAEAWGTGPDAAFTAACHAATGGNPFLLAELVAHLRGSGIAPSADQAGRVSEAGPRSVARSIRRRLEALPRPCVDLARTVAILGTDADLRHAAALAGMPTDEAAHAVDALAAAELLRPGRPLEFVHPVVRAAVRDDLAAGERDALHRRAAELLAGDGAPAGRVAVHLLAVEPRGDEWVARALRTAGVRALERGAPEAAEGFLHRALAEPPGPGERVGILRELGRAALMAGDPAGAEHYQSAVEASSNPAERAAIGREAGIAHIPNGAYDAAVRALQQALADARASGDRELELLVEADLAQAVLMAPATIDAAREQAKRLLERDDLDASEAGRGVLCSLTIWATCSGRSAAEAIELADRGLAGGMPLDPTRSNVQWGVAYGLAVADDLDRAAAVLEESRTRARERGSILTVARAASFLSFVELRRGDVRAAIDEAAASLDASQGRAWFLRRMTTGFLVDALRERGDFEAAQKALAAVGAEEHIEDVFMWNLLLFARGRLRVAAGDAHKGVADLEELGRRETRWRGDNPGSMPWRSAAVRGLLALGLSDEARRAAAEELELARVWGTPRAIGVAQHSLALAREGPRARVSGLEEAVATLERSPARLELAHALVDLGAALRQARRRSEARAPLESGMDVAARCGARALAERAVTELRATGARPRRLAISGVDALTASERRVAQLAARGMTNREIAQALFVTLRTVEVHLTHAYGKLGITSRTELPTALGNEGSGSSDEFPAERRS